MDHNAWTTTRVATSTSNTGGEGEGGSVSTLPHPRFPDHTGDKNNDDDDEGTSSLSYARSLGNQ